MSTKQNTLLTASAHRMCFDADSIYTSAGKEISRWDKGTKEHIATFTVPPNDNLNRGAIIGVDEKHLYFNSIYFFHVADKETHEVIYQKQFGSDNSSDFFSYMLVDDNHVYFPQRNSGLVVVDKGDYENVRYLNKDTGSVWSHAQDGDMVYIGGVDKNIYAFDKETLSRARTFIGHRGNIHYLYSHKDYLISTSADNSIIIWDKGDGSIVHQIKKARCSLGRTIMTDEYVVCVVKNTIKIWEVGSWKQVLQAPAFGELYFDDDVLYLAHRNIPRIGVFTIPEILSDSSGVIFGS